MPNGAFGSADDAAIYIILESGTQNQASCLANSKSAPYGKLNLRSGKENGNSDKTTSKCGNSN